MKRFLLTLLLVVSAAGHAAERPNIVVILADDVGYSDLGCGRDWANVSNTPFRDYKHWVHEGGIATPLIVHWPAGVSAPRCEVLI